MTCPACGLERDGSDKWGGPDPCLGHLPGVISACCGHGCGRPNAIYLWTEDRKYAGREAFELMRELGGNPPAGDYPERHSLPMTPRSRERA